MSRIKTVAVIGEFEDRNGDKHYSFECDVFGQDCEYFTAKEFIDVIRDMFRKTGFKYEIKNIVIG